MIICYFYRLDETNRNEPRWLSLFKCLRDNLKNARSPHPTSNAFLSFYIGNGFESIFHFQISSLAILPRTLVLLTLYLRLNFIL